MGTGKGHTVALGSETNPSTEPASGEAPTASPSIAPGSLVADKYRVVRTIGEGGMGVVVEAMHIHLGQRVAIKFLKREARSDGEIVARFAREARAAVQLTSEHVARVMDIGTLPDGAPFMVMEYLEGKDLSVVLAETGALPVEDAVEYVIQICDGLAEAHARGIVHRDVKTENLFLVERGGGMRIAKLLDFGISKAALTGEASDVDVRSAKTTQIMGSPFYMSPEQLKSTVDVDHRTDIWSLGAVLFELLAGDTAFEGETFTSLVIRINNEAPRDLQALNPAVPDALVRIVRRCLEKNPADRFPNAAELAIALLPYARKRARVPAERAASITRDAGLGAATLVLPASEVPPSMSLRDSAGRVSSSKMGVASSTNDAIVTPQ
ncbi:MAG: serine/threonine-protein kinase, partial [Polyangiaceae bacterium]